MTFDEQVSKVLDRVSRGDRVNIFSIIMWHAKEGDRNKQRLIASFMEGKDLIKKEKDSHSVAITGINIVKDYGSWLNYIESQETDKQTIERLKNKNETFERRIKKTNTLIAFGVLFFTAVGVYLAWYSIHQTNKTQELQEQLRLVTKERDSLGTVINDHQLLLRKANKEIIEMKNSLDSLKLKLTIDK